jgi:hypothetical protein
VVKNPMKQSEWRISRSEAKAGRKGVTWEQKGVRHIKSKEQDGTCKLNHIKTT